MQCHTIKIAQKLGIYNRFKTIAVMKSIRRINVKLQELIVQMYPQNGSVLFRILSHGSTIVMTVGESRLSVDTDDVYSYGRRS